MEQFQRSRREDMIPAEVVEEYRQCPREVVESYRRPMPRRCMEENGEKRPRRRRRHRRRTGLWIFLVCFALVGGLTAGAFLMRQPSYTPWDDFDYHYDLEDQEQGETQEITIPTAAADPDVTLEVAEGHGPTLTAQEIYARVNPSVVTVIAQLGENGASVGTGVIFTEDGYILTNYHVLEGGTDCTVALSTGHSYEAFYVAGDAENDLAVLKADLTGLPAAQFGDSEDLAVGDPVYAIGNPLGYELRGTLTDGIVSAINRDVWVDGRTMNLIQTNAALNTGNSGGPLINAYGQVVGINTIKMTSSYSNVEGLGFAIPSATIRSLVNDLLAYGEAQPEPVLGVTVLSLGTQLEENLWGIEVQGVTPGSAAALAGIRPGDYVVSCGRVEVTSSQDLLRARRQYRVGDEMPLTIWRDGELLDVTLELSESTQAAASESTQSDFSVQP